MVDNNDQNSIVTWMQYDGCRHFGPVPTDQFVANAARAGLALNHEVITRMFGLARRIAVEALCFFPSIDAETEGARGDIAIMCAVATLPEKDRQRTRAINAAHMSVKIALRKTHRTYRANA